ncbi:DsbA family protein [Bacteroidales bacterium OttesenSCG-928-A17]|nr:DsbA family protein [Bacteroidales bacterium OttesenSCG-928-A17]
MSFIKITPSDHIQGNAEAPIELVEYGDYQCSYCGQAYYIVKNLQRKLGKDLKFVFRNYPLEELHPNAMHAAIAAETAAEMGKFWEMHDILFENQRRLDDSSLIHYAQKIGLDVNLFEKEFGSSAIVEKVKYDIDSGNKNGVSGTPSFFVNGKFFDGNWTGPEFLKYLKSLI